MSNINKREEGFIDCLLIGEYFGNLRLKDNYIGRFF